MAWFACVLGREHRYRHRHRHGYDRFPPIVIHDHHKHHSLYRDSLESYAGPSPSYRPKTITIFIITRCRISFIPPKDDGTIQICNPSQPPPPSPTVVVLAVALFLLSCSNCRNNLSCIRCTRATTAPARASPPASSSSSSTCFSSSRWTRAGRLRLRYCSYSEGVQNHSVPGEMLLADPSTLHDRSATGDNEDSSS